MAANLLLVGSTTQHFLRSQNAGPHRHAHPEAPHEVLKTARLSDKMLTRLRNGVETVEGKVTFSAHPLHGLHVHFGVKALVAGDGLVQETFAFLLFAPKARANQAHAVDDDEVRVSAGCEFVVELKGDVVGVRGVENFTQSDGGGVFRTAGDDIGLVFVDPRLVVKACSGLEGHALEGLVDGVVRGASFHDAIGNTVGFGLGDDVVGMNQVHDRKRR